MHPHLQSWSVFGMFFTYMGFRQLLWQIDAANNEYDELREEQIHRIALEKATAIVQDRMMRGIYISEVAMNADLEREIEKQKQILREQ